MPIYNPKQLGEPEVIREINPTVLCAFLKPFEGYLRTRGLEVKEPSRFDNAAIEKLVDILINPTMKTPQRLLNAVFYVEEMSSPLAADSLLKLAKKAGMPFDENENHTLADVVMQVWLFDSKMVEAQHAWQTWKTPRRMECFQPVQSTGISPFKRHIEFKRTIQLNKTCLVANRRVLGDTLLHHRTRRTNEGGR